jgi:hypothetical protein
MKYENQSNAFEKKINYHPTTIDKLINIIHFELNLNISQFINRLFEFNKFRKNIIHPEKISKYHKSNKKENVKFLKLIYEIIRAVK